MDRARELELARRQDAVHAEAASCVGMLQALFEHGLIPERLRPLAKGCLDAHAEARRAFDELLGPSKEAA